MPDDNVVDLYSNQVIKEQVLRLWSIVFKASNKIIIDAGIFGFSGFEMIPDPNIHQIMKSMTAIDSMLDIVLDYADVAEIDHDCMRLTLNAKQQILLMINVVAALKNNDSEEFTKAIDALQQQAPF